MPTPSCLRARKRNAGDVGKEGLVPRAERPLARRVAAEEPDERIGSRGELGFDGVTWLGSEGKNVSRRRIDESEARAPIFDQRHIDGKIAPSLDELLGPVQRIDEEKALRAGEHIFFVDVDAGEEPTLRRIMDVHPQLRSAGIDFKRLARAGVDRTVLVEGGRCHPAELRRR